MELLCDQCYSISGGDGSEVNSYWSCTRPFFPHPIYGKKRSGHARLRYWCLESSQPDGFGPSIFAYELVSSEDITFTIQFTDDEASGPVLAP